MSKAAQASSLNDREGNGLLEPAGSVGSGGLIRHAAALALAETAIDEPDGMVLDTTIQALAPVGGGPIRAEATLLHGSGSRRVWQVVLRDSAGATVAIVSQTRAAAAPAPAPLPEAAAPLTTLAEARRRRLLDAALPVIAARGFANATMREIAAAAGLHVPTMYLYARSKDELLLMIFEKSLTRSEAEMRAVAALPTSATERLRAVVELLMDKSERRRSEIRLFAREAASLPPGMRAQMHARWASVLGVLQTILREGIAAGEFADVDTETTAHLIESLCEAWSLRRFVMRRHGLAHVSALVQRLLATGLQPGGNVA